MSKTEKEFLKRLGKLMEKYNISVESTTDDYGNTTHYFSGKDVYIDLWDIRELTDKATREETK